MKKYSIWLIGPGMQKRLGEITAAHINAACDQLLKRLRTVIPDFHPAYELVRDTEPSLLIELRTNAIRIVDEDARKAEQRAIQSLFELPKP